MVAKYILILASVLTLACAKPTPLDRRESVPEGFVENGPASAATILDLRIALVSNNMAGLEKALFDVSTPSSSLYGQHLTKAQVETLTHGWNRN